jgi:5'-3' exonuclease
MNVHLVDGTYELFRAFYAKTPGHRDEHGLEVGAVRGVVSSMVAMLGEGATHLGVATDHVIESFRNDLWDGYKTGEGIDPVLLSQFPLLEDSLCAFGFTVWAMVDQEADDALAAAAVVAAADPRVEQVVICTPDKDLGQCVGGKIVQLDRRNRRLLDPAGVRGKFGVDPESIPDYLALVGDSADGFPGLPGWGAKSAAAVLARYGHIEAIPDDPRQWDVQVRNAATLAETLHRLREAAMHFRVLATLRVDAAVGQVDDWRWNGPAAGFEEWSARLGSAGLAKRTTALAATRKKGS